MTRVIIARVEHGPCETCGEPILPGQGYRVARGRCLPGEEPVRTKDGSIYSGGLHFSEKVTVDLPDGGTIVTWVPTGFVSFKRHDGCNYPERRK